MMVMTDDSEDKEESSQSLNADGLPDSILFAKQTLC